MRTVTVKFGGSSLAGPEQFKMVSNIIKSDPARRFVVASAPGKRNSADTKVTDLLYKCCSLAQAGDDYIPVLTQIQSRFADIIRELEIDFDLDSEIEIIKNHLETDPQSHYMASRGEYLNSKILAKFIGYDFIDPVNYIFFKENGLYNDERTQRELSAALQNVDNAVVAGFYGSMPDGTVHTFSRGGSDLTGAIVAAAVRADCYENWTDVSGMLAADPRIVENPRAIDYITFQELRELSYMGASVLHDEAVFPVRKANIPINIRNTMRPEDPGTFIEATVPRNRKPVIVTGIAGHTGFSSIQVEKSMMNTEVGFVADLFQILANHGVSLEHCPTGIDTISVVVRSEYLKPCREGVLREIREKLEPDVLIVEDNIALIAIVGQGMAYSRGVAAKIFAALSNAGVNIRMIDQGSSELNIIIGVEEDDYKLAIKSIYEAVM